MEASVNEHVIIIRLSRRNLRTLLAKLDGHPPGSTCRIARHFDGFNVFVHGEEDEAHYGERTPGEMHPETEAVLR